MILLLNTKNVRLFSEINEMLTDPRVIPDFRLVNVGSTDEVRKIRE